MVFLVYLVQRIRPVVIILTLKAHLQNLVPVFVVVVVDCNVCILHIKFGLEHRQVAQYAFNFCVASKQVNRFFVYSDLLCVVVPVRT